MIMISRLSLRLLRSFNRRLIINGSKRAFCTPRIYSTLIPAQRTKPNLKSGYKFSTVVPHIDDVLEVNDVEDDTPQFGLKYYMHYMQNNPDYHGTLFNIETVREETKSSKNELLLAFRDLVKNESQMNEENVIAFKAKLTDEKAWLSYNELMELIHDLASSETLNLNFNDHLLDMMTILNLDCYNRFPENTIDQNLCMALLWTKVFDKIRIMDKFLFKCKVKYCYKFKNISKTQAGVLFYLIGRQKRFPPIENDYFIWADLEHLLQFLTIEEIALISRTFFIMRMHGFTFKSILFILDKLSDEVHTYNETPLIDALKGIQFCLPFHQNHPALEKFQQSLANTSERFSLHSLTYGLFTGVSRVPCNQDLLNVTLNRFKNELNDCSWNLIGRFCYVLSTYNIIDEEFFDLVLQRIRNNFDEKDSHAIVSIIYHLVLLDIFPEDIISNILSTEFQNSQKKKKNSSLFKRLSLFLDVTVDIEKPDYVGSRLSEKSRIKRSNEIHYSILSCKKFDFGKHMYTFEEAVGKIAGIDNGAVYKKILPNFGVANVIMKLDKNLKTMEIPQEYRDNKIRHKVLKPLDNDHYWVAFRLLKNVSFAYKDQLKSYELCCNRQLKKLGYTPLTIKFGEWYQLKKDDESSQLGFLKNKMKETLE